MADAYLINPVLNAERARLRAIDEQVALAKSGLRPFISGSADSAFLNTNTQRSTTGGASPFRRWCVNRADQQAFPANTRHHAQEQSPLTKHSVRAKSVRTTG